MQVQTQFGLLQVEYRTYLVDEGLAVMLTKNGELFATLSVNLPDHPLGKDEFHAKTWSENAPLVEPLLASGLFIDTGRRVDCGFTQASVWRIA
jgi:hypothetical protein